MKSHEATTADEATNHVRAHANGTPQAAWKKFAARAKEGVAAFPSSLEQRIKSDPYKTVGLAAAAGVGLGVLLGSRILRAALTSAVSFAVVELTRAYLRERIAPVHAESQG